MSFNLQEIVGNIFHINKKEKEEAEKKSVNLQQTTKKVLGTNDTPVPIFNPFLKRNGELFNPNLDYQKILDSPYISAKAKSYISQATGLSPTPIISSGSNASSGNQIKFNANLDSKNLASLDVVSELPKLSESQISSIISKHFSKSTVIKPSDAAGIFKAQQDSGMSALAILGIGALESGYGTSNIAKKKNNIWGWGASNSNPSANAKSFSQMSQGASEFANSFMKTYYNGYGAKSIYSAGTGSNPAGKGYAYNDDGSISTEWATKVGSIMGTFYNTAKGNSQSTQTTDKQNHNKRQEVKK